MEGAEIEAFRGRVASEIRVLLGTFPARMAEVEAVLQDPTFAMGPEEFRAPLDIPMPDPAQKKKKKGGEEEEEEAPPPAPPVPPHGAMVALLRRVRPLLERGRADLQRVEAWLKLQIPRIEDGDNFGVAVQEKVVELLTSSRSRLEELQGRIPKYFLERGDAVAKAVKNAHVLDYRSLVDALDAAELGAARSALTELRDLYAVLLDALRKNMEKLRKPRGEPKAMIF